MIAPVRAPSENLKRTRPEHSRGAGYVRKAQRNRFVEQNGVRIRTAVDKYQGAGIAAHTYDLSTGGARIVTSKAYAIGTIIRVRLDLAGTDQFVNLDGEVKWVKSP